MIGSVFADVDMSELIKLFDLKGSWVGRKASNKELTKSLPCLKDMDLQSWGRPLGLGQADRTHLAFLLARDSAFLAQHECIDYSLLLGLKYLKTPKPFIAKPVQPRRPVRSAGASAEERASTGEAKLWLDLGFQGQPVISTSTLEPVHYPSLSPHHGDAGVVERLPLVQSLAEYGREIQSLNSVFQLARDQPQSKSPIQLSEQQSRHTENSVLIKSSVSGPAATPDIGVVSSPMTYVSSQQSKQQPRAQTSEVKGERDQTTICSEAQTWTQPWHCETKDCQEGTNPVGLITCAGCGLPRRFPLLVELEKTAPLSKDNTGRSAVWRCVTCQAWCENVLTCEGCGRRRGGEISPALQDFLTRINTGLRVIYINNIYLVSTLYF